MRSEPRLLLLGELLERVCHRLHRGQGIAHSKPRIGRHLGLVVSELAARLLPGRARSVRLPRLLRRALLDGRAEHDRLSAAGRGAVPALGRAGARRVRVRPEAPGGAARHRRRVRRTRAAPRRPARAGADLAEVEARRGDPRVAARLARSVAATRVRPRASLVGRDRAAARRGGRRPRRTTSTIRRRSATSAAARRRTRRSPPPWPRPRSPSTSTSATTTSRPRPPMPRG